MSRLILSLLVLVTIPAHAYAMEINEAGAQKLKSVFQGILDYEKVVTESMGGIELKYDGDLTVDMHEDYYTVTTPNIIIQEEGNTNPESAMTIGTFAINAMPDEKEGLWKTTITIPSSYTITDEESFGFHIGEQNIVAMLDERLGYFTKINMNLSNIDLKQNGEKFEIFDIGDIQFYINLEEDAEQGLYSGPGHFKITNIAIDDPSAFNTNTYEIGEFRFDMDTKGMKLPTLQEYQAKFEKHATTLEALYSTDQKIQEEIDPNAVIEMFTDLYNFEMDGMSFAYSVKDATDTANSQDENREYDAINLASATLGFGFDGLAQEKGSLNIKLGYDDFVISPTEEFRSTTMPNDLNIDISALNIPYQSLIQMAQTTMASVAQNPESANMAGLGLMMRLPAILAQSETQIVVENNGVKNDIYDLSLNGKVMTDLESMIGFSAQFNAVFQGLDELFSVVKTETEKANPPSEHQYYGFFTQLQKLKSIGVSETNESGKPAYSFNFETTPQGQMMINGQDAMTVFSE